MGNSLKKINDPNPVLVFRRFHNNINNISNNNYIGNNYYDNENYINNQNSQNYIVETNNRNNFKNNNKSRIL